MNDVIIVGGGHNGLVCAAYLARAGKKVTVLERREVLGGCAVTEEVFPGCKVSRASYVNSLFRPEIISDLKLKNYGLEFLQREPGGVSVFPDKSYLIFSRDMAATQAQIAKFSAKDAENYPRYEAWLEQYVDLLEPLWDEIPPSLTSNKLGNLWQLGRLGRRFRNKGAVYLQGLADLFTLSCRDLLDRWFESEQLICSLATDGLMGVTAGPYTPGTGYVLLHHCMGETDGRRNDWAFVRGGMGAFSESIATACRKLGVEIRCNAEVEEIIVENNSATGVRLNSGDVLGARAVASCATPQITFLDLLGANRLPVDFTEAIQRIDYQCTDAKMNLLLSELPNYKAMPGTDPGPMHGGTVHICVSMDYLEKAFNDCKHGSASTQPFLEVTTPTAVDDTLAPDGQHLMGISIQYTPYALRNSTWEAERENYARRILDVLNEYAPNLRDSVLNYELLLPADLERVFGITGGNNFHGAMGMNNIFSFRPASGYADYRSPIKNLFLCGAGAHPGGGVTGAPGRNASKVILKDI